MNNSGSGLLIATLAVLALLILAAAVFFHASVPTGAAGAPGTPSRGPSIRMTMTCARLPTGMQATVTVANAGMEEAKNLRITKVTCGSLNNTAALPITLGVLPPKGTTTFSVPLVGSVPAGLKFLSLNVDYDYHFGWLGKGGGSSGVTSILP